MLDLCYEEDSGAMVDLNCVMNGRGELVELQGTGEGHHVRFQHNLHAVGGENGLHFDKLVLIL